MVSWTHYVFHLLRGMRAWIWWYQEQVGRVIYVVIINLLYSFIVVVLVWPSNLTHIKGELK